jgi:hypothetical protein
VRLTRRQCWSLLAEQTLGRLAVVEDGAPTIRLVRYQIVDAGVLLTGPDLVDVAGGTVVALEVDHVDPGEGSAWSVVATGQAQPGSPRPGREDTNGSRRARSSTRLLLHSGTHLSGIWFPVR